MAQSVKVSVVLPAYNEEENLVVLASSLQSSLNAYDYEIIFVDDGSSDNSLKELRALNDKDFRIKFLSFSRNFGHQQALRAGLDHACGDCVIVMDADMQHPASLLVSMIEHWQNGYEVVYTIRTVYGKVSLTKKASSAIFYKILNMLSQTTITQGRADFFLLDRKVADVLKTFIESPLFFRGIIPWVGFKQIGLNYEAAERHAGVSKYSFVKMMEFAIDGVTSFSIKPLRLSFYMGIAVSAAAFFYLFYALYIKFFSDRGLPGWTSLMVCVLFIGGIQLIMLGIVGEYIGKLFMQSKGRPSYIISEKSRGF